MPEESNLMKHAKKELERIGAFSEEGDFYGGMTGKAVMELVETFSKQMHSIMSANIVLQLFNRVANWEPLSPLQGTEDEWSDLIDSYDGSRQNKRCSRVFMSKDGQGYDIRGKIFREPDGVCYTSKDSTVPVTFPYTPKTKYIDVPKQAD